MKLTKNIDTDKCEYSDYSFAQVHNFYYKLVNEIQMLLFLVWTIVNQGIMTIGKKISCSWWEVNRCIKWYYNNNEG